MRFVALVLGLVLAALPALCQEGRSFTLEELLFLTSIHSLDLSPDGERVAMVVTRADLEEGLYQEDIWVAWADGRPPRQLTRGQEDETRPLWSPDGRWLAFLAPHQEASAIWLLPTDGGEPFPLTSPGQGDVSLYAWGPDSRHLYFLAREPAPPARAGEEEWRRQRRAEFRVREGDRRPVHFWSVDLEGDSQLLMRGDPGLADFALAPQGSRAAFISNRTGAVDSDDAYNLFVYDWKTGQRTELTSFASGPAGPPGRQVAYDGFRGAVMPRWSPDGRQVAYAAHIDPELTYSRADIWVVPATGGAPRNLSAQADRFVMDFQWRGSALVFVAADGCNQHLYRVDPQKATVRLLTPGEGCWDSLALSPDGRRAAAVYEDSRRGPEVRWFPLERPEQARTLTAFNDKVKEWRLPDQEVISWNSEGWRIEGVLTRPLGFDPGRRYPLLLAPHGGPFWHATNTLRRGLPVRWLAQKGYAVLAPNFRGSDGYGNAFAVANRGDLGGGDYRDIMAGLAHLKAQGWVDPERLGVMGGSYGGYMTNWMISQSDQFKAAVSMYGIFNLVTDFSNSEIPSFETDYLGYYYWQNPDIYRERSPSTYVERIRTPVLLLHGEADNNTFLSNSLEMYTALRKLGGTVELVTYPREGHGIADEPNHYRDACLRLGAWFDRYLLGHTAEPGDWTLHLVEARRADYPGEVSSGRLVEVVFYLETTGDSQRPLTLPLSSVQLETASGLRLTPLGIPQETLGQRVLVRGQGLEVRLGASGPALRRT
ncbi:MAG TPA: S9 family peptidase, partial [Candidatus Nitrosotenuis sp.]|nr:S9 family peptidase [Candidatus Nitrosotenuis sp.]